jgi:two-component system, LytTR family, sensor kinase
MLLDTNNDLWFRIIVVPVFGFLVPSITPMVTECSTNLFFREYPYIYTVFCVIFLYETNRLIILLFRNKFKRFDLYIYRLLLQLAFQFVFCILTFVFLLYVWYFEVLGSSIYIEYMTNNVYFGLSATLIVTLYYEMSFYISIWKKENLLNQELELINVKSQMSLLQRHISPHFLFNSLSTLSSLIDDKNKQALDFIDSFSESYRYLIKHDEVLTELGSEIDFLKSFTSVLVSTYGSSLNFNFDVPLKAKSFKILTFSLQMLVENAMKHNLHSKIAPLNVDIYVEDEKFLIVKNNINFKKNSSSNKTGLNNIIKRYELLNYNYVNVFTKDNCFFVKLPLIPNES